LGDDATQRNAQTTPTKYRRIGVGISRLTAYWIYCKDCAFEGYARDHDTLMALESKHTKRHKPIFIYTDVDYIEYPESTAWSLMKEHD
jgi:hypothetical protein